MNRSAFGMCPQGLPYVLIPAFFAVVLAILDYEALSILALFSAAYAGHVYRDPDRIQPEDMDTVAAPADGKVVSLGRGVDPVTGEERRLISIVIGPLDVRVLRMPVSAKIETLRHVDGQSLPARRDEAREMNERVIMELTGKGNQRFSLVLMSGLLFRGFSCLVEKGEKLKRSDRFGLLASRVDLFLPEGYVPIVYEGEKVLGGQTPLAEKRTT